MPTILIGICIGVVLAIAVFLILDTQKAPSARQSHPPSPAKTSKKKRPKKKQETRARPWWDARAPERGGEVQKITNALRKSAQQERRRWDQEFADRTAQIRAKHDELRSAIAQHEKQLSASLGGHKKKSAKKAATSVSGAEFKRLTNLHFSSMKVADSTHSLLTSARLVLDSLGHAIVSAAKSRDSLIQRKRRAKHNEAANLESQIRDMIAFKDRVLTPDKDQVKAQRNQLKGRVTELNQRTAAFRDLIRDTCGQQGRDWFARLDARKKQRARKSAS